MKSNFNNIPRFSVIIPTYNSTDVLEQCLEGLYDQSVDKQCFEIIVVNDGGKNHIHDNPVFEKNQFALNYYYQDHKGPAAARNFAINKAKGEIILFLDDDSLPAKDWIKANIRAWDISPKYDGIGGYIISELRDSIYCKVNSDFFNWYIRQYSNSKNCTFLTTCNAGYRKASLNKVGNFDERFKKASGEDRDLSIRIAKSGGKLRLDENILVYHNRNLTLGSFISKHYNYGKAAYKIYTSYPELERMSLKNYVNYYLSILPNYKTLKEKLLIFFLLTLAQIFTAVGYYSAVLLRLSLRILNSENSN